MAQAAGRCNREGRLQGLGEVVVFTSPKAAPTGLLRKGEEAGREMLRCHQDASTSLNPDGFKRYFELFYAKVSTFDKQDMRGLLETSASSGEFQFRTAAIRFQLIDDEAQQSIVVWYPPRKAEIQRQLDEMQQFPTREGLRKLQRFTVTLPERGFKALADRGEILDYGGIWGQAVDGLYHEILGLCPKGSPWNPELYNC
jgi:CRISPR-associated endonuclease/helicase Cas3